MEQDSGVCKVTVNCEVDTAICAVKLLCVLEAALLCVSLDVVGVVVVAVGCVVVDAM